MRNLVKDSSRLTGLLFAIFILIATISLPSLSCSKTHSTDMDVNLQAVVSEIVNQDAAVRNCVLAVERGDGSYSWAGAAGIASYDGQVPMTRDTPILIASVTKMFTAAAIMKLYEGGALSLDDPMSEYLPEDLIKGIHVYEEQDYSGEITIRQLLSHTSGIADYYTEKSSEGYSLYELFLQRPDSIWTVDDTIIRARDKLKAHFPPGTNAFYADTNYQLLGKIIEKVTAKSLEDVYEEFFFLPLGMKHSYLIGRSEPQIASSRLPADIWDNDKSLPGFVTTGHTGLMVVLSQHPKI